MEEIVVSKPPAKTGEAKPAAGEKVAQKPTAKSGEAKPAVGKIVVPEPPAKLGEAKPAAGEKVAQKPPAKTGEAKPAVVEKLAQKAPAKNREAKPAVDEIVVPKPPDKTGEAKPAAGEKLTSKPQAKSGEAKPDVFEEHALELASVIDANEPSVAALSSKSGSVRPSTIYGASRPAEPLQQPTASGDLKKAVKKPTLTSTKQPQAKKPKNIDSAIEESVQRLTTNKYQKKEESSSFPDTSLPHKVNLVFFWFTFLDKKPQKFFNSRFSYRIKVHHIWSNICRMFDLAL